MQAVQSPAVQDQLRSRFALTKSRKGVFRPWTLKGSVCWRSAVGRAAKQRAQLTLGLGGVPTQLWLLGYTQGTEMINKAECLQNPGLDYLYYV